MDIIHIADGGLHTHKQKFSDSLDDIAEPWMLWDLGYWSKEYLESCGMEFDNRFAKQILLSELLHTVGDPDAQGHYPDFGSDLRYGGGIIGCATSWEPIINYTDAFWHRVAMHLTI